jgi:hypothetical protein
MTRQFLSIPVVSTTVEGVFTFAGLTLSETNVSKIVDMCSFYLLPEESNRDFLKTNFYMENSLFPGKTFPVTGKFISP